MVAAAVKVMCTYFFDSSCLQFESSYPIVIFNYMSVMVFVNVGVILP